MKRLSEITDSILLQNNHAQITISKQDASVQQVIDLTAGKNIRGEMTHFFALFKKDETPVIPTELALTGNCITVTTPVGAFSVQVDVDEDYFAFTLVTPLPADVYKCFIANVKYTYDYENKENTGACGVAMTYWVDPVFWPDCKSLETRGEIIRHLKDVGGKYALIIAPIVKQKDIIKKACRTIDPNEGLVSEIGGAWGRDSRLNFGNYLIDWWTYREYIENNLPFYKSLGIDHVDFEKSEGTFRQGDFKFAEYPSGAEFKKNVSDVLAKEGIGSSLHTYSFYIHYECDTILADPKWQKDLGVLETFTLAQDISADADFLPTKESTACVSTEYTFFFRNTPFLLVGEEIIKFENAPDGFKVAERGWAGTKAVAHHAGETIKHIDGYYRGIAPVPGSELYLQIARLTAKAYNEGGFSMIYLDALDGIRMHCQPDEVSYYGAMFICEVMRNCKKTPLIEFAMFRPAFWAARGRVGAVDYPYRGYKSFFNWHVKQNLDYIDRYSVPTMGWHHFFQWQENHPGNAHTKYHFPDEIAYLGSLSLMYDFGMVYSAMEPKFAAKYAGLKRNAAIYKPYDDLRKAGYFSKALLEKLRQGKWEYHLKQKDSGEYVFEEKTYQKKKLYELTDADRNTAKFNNPFDAQVPFIRIESMLSSAGKNPVELLPLDENRDLTEQTLVSNLDEDINLNDKLARKVRVLGNGKPGSAIGIRSRRTTLKSARGYLLHVIDTDFEGWRDFTLVETDVTERPELDFDLDKNGHYPIHSHLPPMPDHVISQTEILTAGDVTGVRMSSVIACEHTYEVLKNPTVKIGDTQIQFICELMSTDYLEFDGKTAKVYDRYGNEKEIYYESTLSAPAGEFKAELISRSLNGNPARAQLTLGFTGKEITD